jgi:hypothetical protein
MSSQAAVAALALVALAPVSPAGAATSGKRPAAPPPAAAAAEASGKGEASEADLRRAAQNPVANMISLPLQNNTGFSVGPYHRPQNVLNVQPVIPFKITPDWNLITRWVTPVIWQPRMSPGLGAEAGLGNVQPSFFLSPARPGKVIWGIGPAFWLPTASANTLGVNKWGAGPAVVALTIEGPWVIGALASNVWAGTTGRRVNQMTIQPFVNYNLPHGWYLTTSPVVTANWLARSQDRWTVPVGGGFGRLFKVDKLPINAQVQAFYNVARPQGAPTWTLRFQVQALFPTF